MELSAMQHYLRIWRIDNLIEIPKKIFFTYPDLHVFYIFMAKSQKEHDLTKLKVGRFSQETLSLMLPSEPGGSRGKLPNISYSMSLLEQFVLQTHSQGTLYSLFAILQFLHLNWSSESKTQHILCFCDNHKSMQGQNMPKNWSQLLPLCCHFM